MKLEVLVRSEAEGGYSVSVPAMPGCYSQGETLDEALRNIREAADLWVEVVADRQAGSFSHESGRIAIDTPTEFRLT